MPGNSKILATSFLAIVLAATHGKSFATHDEGDLKKILQAKIPELKIDTVEKSPIPGLYEVIANTRIFYSDPTGAHIVIGNIINTSSQKDLTEIRSKEINSIDISSLPFHNAITTIKGNGKRVIVTFFDPNCSFCKNMSFELDKIPDSTIHIFLYPILSKDSVEKSRTILCSDNPSLAWRQWFKEGKITTSRTPCQPDIKNLISLGNKLNIKGTPTTFLPSGERVEGFISGNDLISRIERM
ncbi:MULTISPECIES: DsbC family protein [Burkholderia]|uniref:Thiol:disulfide interchange protein n=1 Tax=Burkholderia paludis TaxID=1506587 RepID=A0A6J5DYN4_9BURK|nr:MULTISPECIES: DsbC family protein [Burkholderia]CAB3759249.1 putative thiol:disulfide interchange protein DsbC [Burkholderia paludis]VWB54095.1 thiol:disulfide interchange protein [Burkholderia paludis]